MSFLLRKGKVSLRNQLRHADPVARVLATRTMSDAVIEVPLAVRRGRQVTASDLHRLLRKRLTERAQTFYIEHVRRARPHTVPLQYSIDRILRILTTGMQWYQLDTVHGCWSTHYKRFQVLARNAVFDEINFTVLFRNT